MKKLLLLIMAFVAIQVSAQDVPCIFFMNEAGDAFKYYHTVLDTYDNFLSGSYEPTFKLIKDFIGE